MNLPPIPIAIITAHTSPQAEAANLDGFLRLSRACILPISEDAILTARRTDGRITMSSLTGAWAKAYADAAAADAYARRPLPEIPDYLRMPPEQARADARWRTDRLLCGLPV